MINRIDHYMAFEYCCFISYSHNPGYLPEKFIWDLYNALTSEIGALTREIAVCCVDWDRLKGGDFYNKRLSKALCKSACMVAVYTPTYFDETHTYCTREFKAMKNLETVRFSQIGDSSDDHGLIIPIIYRGIKYPLHPYIEGRQYYDFSKYIPGKSGENALSTHSTYGPEIIEIAEYIYDRYLKFKELWDFSEICRDFELPSEEDARSWLKSASVTDIKTPFPGRQGTQHET
jgi:hypothetical protein